MNVSKVFKLAAISAAVLSVFGVAPRAEARKTSLFGGFVEEVCEKYEPLLEKVKLCECLEKPDCLTQELKKITPTIEDWVVPLMGVFAADELDELARVCTNAKKMAKRLAPLCEEGPSF